MKDAPTLPICNFRVLSLKATSLLSQCESVRIWRCADMCMVYLLAALPRLREVGRGEPLRHQNQTAVYVYVCVFVCV